MLVVQRVFGKHAQIQHRARTAGVFDNDKSAVQNVRHGLAVWAFVAFVEMVDALGTRGKYFQRLLLQNQIHQVEIMAAFFDQRAAGVNAKAVPVVHLGIKRFPVFAHGYLLNAANLAAVGHAD